MKNILITIGIIALLMITGCAKKLVPPSPSPCELYKYSTCPQERCTAICTPSCPECQDCNGPGSCIPKKEPTTCEDYRYNNCPEGCTRICRGSCDMCMDCEGPGSCITLIKTCPDQWISNQMPIECVTEPCEPIITEYYILKGERKETWEFDNEWVKNNCQLEKMIVE